jgi:dTDP-D-glucose 4,6-dehydratase
MGWPTLVKAGLSSESSPCSRDDTTRRDRYCRYFICDDKLAALGWKETIPWEEGLQRTIDWYMKQDVEQYWEAADIDRALQPHPPPSGTIV